MDYTTNAPFGCFYILTAAPGHNVEMTIATGANINPLTDDLFVSKHTTGNKYLP